MNRLRPTKQAGFTTIELVVVLVIIGILLTVVFVTRAGVEQTQRNDERQRDIAELRSNLEGYYAQQDEYPTLKQMNDPAWRDANMKSLAVGVLGDPLGENDTLAGQLAEGAYSYIVKAADGNSCDGEATPCTQYTLSAPLEGGGRVTKNNLN